MDQPIQDTNPPLRLLAGFQQYFPGRSPDALVQAPGREMWAAAVLNGEQTYTIHALDLDAKSTFSWRTARGKKTILNRPLPNWVRYPAGVVVQLCTEGVDLAGVEVILAGEEPPGPRYDFALGMAIAALSYELQQQYVDADTLITLVEQVRRDYVAT